MIDPADRGLLLGDGLFETVLWTQGRLDRFDAHVARLRLGCETLGLPRLDTDVLRAAAMSAVGEANLKARRAAVRLTWTAGAGGRGLDRPETLKPILLATAIASPWPHSPAHVASVQVRRNEGSPASRLKSLAYLDNVLARREAQATGADEALMLNNAGHVACAAAANLFWFAGDTLMTPALECGVLAGVMRTAVIDTAVELGIAVREVRATGEDLVDATGVFLTNSLIGVRPVASLDRRAVTPHSLTRILADQNIA